MASPRILPVVVGVLVGVAISGAQAAAAAERVVVTAGEAAIYAKPSAQSEVVARVKADTVLEVIEGGREWIRVAIPAGLRLPATAPKSGYIAARVVASIAGSGASLGQTAGRAPARPPAVASASGVPRGFTRLNLRPFVVGGYQAFLAKDSFDAVFGNSMGPIVGGGIDGLISRNVFFEVEASYFRRTGERAAVSDGQVYKLGIADRITIAPVTGSVGIRAAGRRKLRPYAGGGAGVCLYSERADYARTGDDVSEAVATYHGFGGVEFAVSPRFAVAVEGLYRSVPGILGKGGVSEVYGESDLGGASIRVRLVFGR